MEKKTLIIFIVSTFLISFFLVLTLLCFSYSNLKGSYSSYMDGLDKYSNSDFIMAQKDFNSVGAFSVLKPIAIYREALCYNKLENVQQEIKKYNKLKKYYKKSKITPKALYSLAKIYYQDKNYTKALKEFKYIAKKYPKTKFAVASNYFIALIESEKYKNNPKKEREILSRAKKYLIDSPNGIYALNCAKLMGKYILSDEEKLIVGKTYLANKDYDHAEKFLKITDISISWPYLVQLYYTNKNYEQVRNYTRQGLALNYDITSKEFNNATYKAIDLYLKTFDNQKLALSTLLNIGSNNPNYDYLMYKNCQNSTGESRFLCYNSIYQLYPNGNFAAESLANVFYNEIKNKNYTEAIKLGKLHLMNYKKTKSSPKVIYWLMYASDKTRDRTLARYYYNTLMNEYPDDYYTYLAFIYVNKLKYGLTNNNIDPQPVEFPYETVNDTLLSALLDVEDYGFINMFYEDDDFIKSWLLYQEGDYTTSSRLARDGMEKLEVKPPKDDLRWRLVYPVHYYEEISNNPTSDRTLILSIIREESYFNPNAQSSAGALGLMQLMPKTAAEIAQKTGYALTNTSFLSDPKTNIKLGVLYFNHIKSLLSGQSRLAILAYNGGIGSVKRWQKTIDSENFEDFIENIPYPETQNYYKKVYKTYWNYLRIYNGLNF